MPAKDLQALLLAERPDDSLGLRDGERDTLPFPPELTKGAPLDAETPADVFDLVRLRSQIPRDVFRVDARNLPLIHSAFFVEGTVPSLNELLDAKGGSAPVIRSIIMRRKPGKGKRDGRRFDLYNEIKQDWSARTIRALGPGTRPVESAFFGYAIIEPTRRRDPSNICSAAIKFIEDGLVLAGVIPNDGWDQVLGIRMVCLHRPGREAGVYVVMSEHPLSEEQLTIQYEQHFANNV